MTSEREAELLTACKQVEHDRRAVYEDDVRYPGVLGTFQEPPSVHIPIAELRDLLATAARERRMREALRQLATFVTNTIPPHDPIARERDLLAYARNILETLAPPAKEMPCKPAT